MGARSRFVFVEGCGSGLFRGVVKISFMSTINYIYRLETVDTRL